jgi:hypothetical protein
MKIFKNRLLQNQRTKFNQTWYKLSLDKGKLSSKKGSDAIQREDDHKKVTRGPQALMVT